MEDVAADKVRQFLDIYDKTNHPSVSNLTVQRIRASFTKRGIRLRYGSNAIVVRDFRLSRSEEHTSELQSLMRISYAVFCLKKKTTNPYTYYESSHQQHTKTTSEA